MKENTCMLYDYRKPKKPIASIGAVVTEPGSTVKNKTGGWRSMRPVVDRQKCIKCHLCWQFCPECAVNTNVEIDYNFCKGCGICTRECPVKAITMEEEEK